MSTVDITLEAVRYARISRWELYTATRALTTADTSNELINNANAAIEQALTDAYESGWAAAAVQVKR